MKTQFKRKSMKSLMMDADKGKWQEYPEYEFSTTTFTKKDKIGGTPLRSRRRYHQ